MQAVLSTYFHLVGRTGQKSALLEPFPRADRLPQGLLSMLPEGATAYEVGGSLRDELLGRDPSDRDFTVTGTGAEELLQAARTAGRADELRVAGRLIGVRLRAPWTPPDGVELALARRESSTGPGHSDFQIEAGAGVSIEEDLARRDFTVNAMAREIRTDGSPGQIIDPLGGLDDLREGVLRQTHPDAMREDPLRVLRGLVRIGRDGLIPDADTALAMAEAAPALRPDGPLSPERVLSELRKTITSPGAAEAMEKARDLGIYAAVFPELVPTIGFDQESRYHRLTVDDHCIGALREAARLGLPEEVRWAALLHDSGKPASAWRGDDDRLHYYPGPNGEPAHEDEGARIAGQIMDRLRAPKELSREVVFLVGEHMFFDDRGFRKSSDVRQGIKARRFIYRVGRDRVDNLLGLRFCDNGSKGGGAGALKRLEDTRAFAARIRKEWNSPLEVSELAVNGNDLKKIGISGPRTGQVLGDFLERVIVDPRLNTRRRLMEWASRA